MDEVALTPRSSAGLADLLGPDGATRLTEALSRIRETLGGRRLWHVNSTARGGGVAEMLSSLLPYAVGAGIDTRWAVIEGDDPFFEVTKRIHNHLHESPGDGGPLGERERAVYDHALATEAEQLCRRVQPGDAVVLHDPQTAGLAPALRHHGAAVVWRCHIGVDRPGPAARRAWDFLRGDVLAADACVFSRAGYRWEGLPADRTVVVAPCIDIASPKNQPLDGATRDAILAACGLVPVTGRVGTTVAGGLGDDVPPAIFEGSDGIVRRVARRAELVQEAPLHERARLIVQVSRWDRLKDPVGVLHGFAFHGPLDDAHLVLAGPAVGKVSDDPESVEVFEEVRQAWELLPQPARRRAHLACLPMDDADENAAIVNALQRRADVVVQKSLAEGFGLTVAEAMWKCRPVVASRVGGVQDQIVHDESGILIDDSTDLTTFGAELTRLLGDGERVRVMGDAAHERVRNNYLPVHHFESEAGLLDRLQLG